MGLTLRHSRPVADTDAPVKPLAAQLMPILVVAAGLLASPLAAASGEYLVRPEVRAFIDSMREEHGIEKPYLERVLGAARHQPVVVRLTNPVDRKSVV